MDGISYRRNIGGLVSQAVGLPVTTAVAGAGSDNVYTYGVAIDRLALKMPLSASVAAMVLPTLASTKTATIKVKITHCDTSDGTFADHVESAATVLSVSAVQSLLANAFDIGGAKRYVKVGVFCDLSNTSTDTAVYAAIATFEGGQEI